MGDNGGGGGGGGGGDKKPPPPSDGAGEDDQVPLLKRVLFSFKKAVKNVNASELPKQVQKDSQLCEQYQVHLNDLVSDMMFVMQGDPARVPKCYSVQEVENPPGTAPYEVFVKKMSVMRSHMTPAIYNGCEETATVLAKELRAFQVTGRSSFTHIRKYMNFEYVAFEEMKRRVQEAADRMDCAKLDMDKNKNGRTEKVYEKATSKYNSEIEKMMNWLQTVPDKKDVHWKDFVHFLRELEKYHVKMADACLRLSKMRPEKPAVE